MKTMTKSFFVLIIMLWGFIVQLAAGVKWVVTDDNLTVWGTPDYNHKLGVLHKGYEFEEKSIDGNKICFDYNGQKGYVPMHCCQKVAPQDSDATVTEATSKVAVSSHSSDGELVEVSAVVPPSKIVKDTVRADNLSTRDVALMGGMFLLGIPLLILHVLAIAFAVFYGIWYNSLRDWFNKRCGTDCIPAGRINKLFKRLLLPSIIISVVAFASNFVNTGVVGTAVIIVVPCFFLFKIFKDYKERYGKTAALWTLAFSVFTIFTIVTLCAMFMLLVFLFIILYFFTFALEQTGPGKSFDMHNRSCSNCNKFGTSACPHQGQAGNGCCGSHSW